VLAKLTNAPDKLLVGRRQGSVLNVDVRDLDPETDGIVSGPPCPPFGSMGKRLVELDARSSVFVAVCMRILHLSRNGRLTRFIIENVSGVAKRKKGASASFAERSICEMMRDLPAGWHIEPIQHNSAQCLLPQSRPRCFFVGIAASLRATPFQRRVFSMAVPSWGEVDIVHFSSPVASPDDWRSLSLRQQTNVLEYLEQYRELCRDPNCEKAARTVGVVDIARDPLKGVDGKIAIGGVRTLRTNNSHLRLLPSPQLEATFGERGRRRNRDEKCRLAGLVPESLSELDEPPDLEIAIGNTIPVPLIGVVLAPVLRAWAHMERSAELKCD